MDVQTIILIVTEIISAASAFVAATPTPDPNTTLGKVYKVVELLALVVGKAKQDGLLPPTRNDRSARAEADKEKGPLRRSGEHVAVSGGHHNIRDQEQRLMQITVTISLRWSGGSPIG